jgi:hypothetical protein
MLKTTARWRIVGNMLPTSVFQQLDGMDDYDRLLAYDRIGRENRLSAEEVQAQFEAYKRGEVGHSSLSTEDIKAASGGVEITSETQYLQDAERYRAQYDPSHEGQARQADVSQAIICPHCSSALGIPSTRPIKVTCPNCMMEAVFTS